ncbi:putative defensin, plant [Lupinus albus]|uniref:Putative defensin, plant n=1 Tax=Lupinus albus TaxID=3870 RepID=A0A6A4PNA5_LUPAL|nr:putative defensin, plant [Lupinus albus]
MGPTMMAEARTCKSESQKFKGSCYSDTNCATICEGEGFTRGKCHGFFSKCWCKRLRLIT